MLLALAAVLLLLPASPDSVVVDEVAPEARIYLYGHLLSRPYRFTGVGADTLMLNDLPFFPTRRPASHRAPERGRIDDRMEEVKAIASQARRGKPPREALDAAAAVVRAEEDVHSVSVDHDLQALRIKFAWHPREVTVWYSLDTEEERLPGGRAEAHLIRINAIRAALAAGVTVGRGWGYSLFLPHATVAGIEAEAERVATSTEGAAPGPAGWGRLEARMIADIRAARTAE